MKKTIKKTEIYEFTLSELLKALKLKIPKSKNIHLTESYDLGECSPTLQIVVSKK